MSPRRVQVSSGDEPKDAPRSRQVHLPGVTPQAAGPGDVPAWRRASATPQPDAAVPSPAGEQGPNLREQISAERLAEAENELRGRMAGARGALDELLRMIPELITGAQASALDAHDLTRRDVVQRREKAAADAMQEAAAQAIGARSTIDRIRVTDAAGAASQPWELLTAAPAPVVPRLLRYGELDIDGLTIPALAPLLDQPGWLLTGERAASEQLVVAVLTRILAMVPARHLRVEIFDPRLRGIMGRFASLRSAFGASFPAPASDATAFASRLGQLMDSAGSNVELAMAAGARTLTEVWSATGVPEGQVNLLVVLDYPYAVDQRLNEQLLRAASIGGPSGTSLLVVADSSTPPAPEVDPGMLARLLRPLVNVGDRWRDADLPGDVRSDPLPPPEVVSAVVSTAIDAASSLQGPVIPLADVIAADIAEPWTASSADALDIVIGREKALPLTLSLRTENPPHPNLLVGGAVGQGKSNLLLDIIYSLAARYRPGELELHLLDFKRGLEFKRFAEDADGRNWLPHARVLCLESSPAFGVAVLRHMEQEMERRSRLFKAAGVASLNAFRAGGQDLSRVVLVIDEFHVLFEGSDAEVDAAVTYLTKLAKQGRAYGIHLLLASQTISGVAGLSVKGDAIFAQFPLRMSLKNTADESQAILSRGNKAAADLTYRGELILNRNFGHDPSGSNVRGVAAYADPDAMQRLQARLWELGHGDPPLMFLGSSFADYRSLVAPTASRGSERVPLWVGRPISVSNEVRELVLTSDVDQAVAIVGQDGDLAAASLRSMLASAVPSLAARNGRIVLLQAVEDDQAAPVRRALAWAQQRGVAVTVVARPKVAAFLREELAPRLHADWEPWLVVAAGLQRVRGMDEGSAHPDDDFTLSFGSIDESSPRGILQRTATQGALAGVHLVGWWPNLRAVRADLPQGNGIGAYITAGLGGEDLKDLVGGLTPAIEGWPRIGLYDLNRQGGLEVLVPFDPDADVAEATE